jgi:hypothetical protein
VGQALSPANGFLWLLAVVVSRQHQVLRSRLLGRLNRFGREVPSKTIYDFLDRTLSRDQAVLKKDRARA